MRKFFLAAVVPIWLIVTIVLFLVTLPSSAQQQPQITYDEIRNMLADRDITIQILNKQVTDLTTQLNECRNPKKPEEKK